MRQEKILALAWVLLCCAKILGALTRVLYNAMRELQRCMAPLMSLSRDDIVEASLLEPTGKECKTSPTQEEEAILMGEEHELPEASQNVQRSPNLQNLLSRLTLLLPLLLLCPLCQNLVAIFPRRQRNSKEGLRLT